MKSYRLTVSAVSLIVSAVLAPIEAQALPMLQLFIESDVSDGSSGQNTTWDPIDQTWVRVGTSPFRLWAVVQGAAANSSGNITKTYNWDMLAFTAVGPNRYFDADQGNGVFSVTATGTGGAAAGFNVTAGPNFGFSSNVLSPLPGGYAGPTAAGIGDCCGPAFGMASHGQYDNDHTWAYWDLLSGPATLDQPTATRIGQFQPTAGTEPFFANGGNYPTPSETKFGWIFGYTINPVGLAPGDVVHFDLWGHVYECDGVGGNCVNYYFAPFSHDARWEQGGPVPAPAALFVLGLGLVGLGALRRR